MSDDEVLKRTSRGASVLLLVKHFRELSGDMNSKIAREILSQIESCVPVEGQPMTSACTDRMWSTYHKLRTSEDLRKKWSTYFQSSSAPANLKEYSLQTLQVLLDRALRYILSKRNTAGAKLKTESNNCDVSVREENVVRYMSGYVAVKLLKKYRKGSGHSKMKSKWKYFVKILEEMKSDEHLFDHQDTLDDYTKAWSEHIDRGGLCHVKPEVSSYTIQHAMF